MTDAPKINRGLMGVYFDRSAVSDIDGAAGRLYLTAADETDIAPQVLRLADAIAAAAPAGLEWLCEPRPDLRHDNIYRSVAPGVLRRLYAADG